MKNLLKIALFTIAFAPFTLMAMERQLSSREREAIEAAEFERKIIKILRETGPVNLKTLAENFISEIRTFDAIKGGVGYYAYLPAHERLLFMIVSAKEGGSLPNVMLEDILRMKDKINEMRTDYDVHIDKLISKIFENK